MKVKDRFWRFGLVLALLFAFLHLASGPSEWVPAPAGYWVDNAEAIGAGRDAANRQRYWDRATIAAWWWEIAINGI